MLAKLSELLFVETLRRYVEGLPEEQTGWLAALKDPFVSRALSLLHGDVARQWTVDELGRKVGLSRSALADRFTRLIGEPPIRYLARWRIQVAAHQLRNTDTPLARIAEQVGYEFGGCLQPRLQAQLRRPSRHLAQECACLARHARRRELSQRVSAKGIGQTPRAHGGGLQMLEAKASDLGLTRLTRPDGRKLIRSALPSQSTRARFGCTTATR